MPSSNARSRSRLGQAAGRFISILQQWSYGCLEAGEHPAFGHLYSADTHVQLLRSDVAPSTLDGGQPEGAPGRIAELRPHLLGGPGEDAPLIVAVPGRVRLGRR